MGIKSPQFYQSLQGGDHYCLVIYKYDNRDRVSALKMLREELDLPLADAKFYLDNRQCPIIEQGSRKKVMEFADKLDKLGGFTYYIEGMSLPPWGQPNVFNVGTA